MYGHGNDKVRIYFLLEYRYQGRIQDLEIGGVWVGEGSGDRLSSPAGPGQSPRRGSRWPKPLPPKLWGFEELQTFIWTTILNQPHHFYQTKKTLLRVLILSDNWYQYVFVRL
jgi:hypothetical protein